MSFDSKSFCAPNELEGISKPNFQTQKRFEIGGVYQPGRVWNAFQAISEVKNV